MELDVPEQRALHGVWRRRRSSTPSGTFELCAKSSTLGTSFISLSCIEEFDNANNQSLPTALAPYPSQIGRMLVAPRGRMGLPAPAAGGGVASAGGDMVRCTLTSYSDSDSDRPSSTDSPPAPRTSVTSSSAGALTASLSSPSVQYPPALAWAQAASLRLSLENVLYWFAIYDNWVRDDDNIALMVAAYL